MKSIIYLFFLIKVAVFCLILGQAMNIQILPHRKLDSYQKNQFFKTVKVKARRGRIYDRKNKELAMVTPSFSLFADPSYVRSPRYAATQIYKIIGADKKSLESKMRKRTRFVWLKRKLDLNTKRKLEKLNISGLHFISESNRNYPEKSVSSQNLGLVGTNGKGLEGLEYYYDKYLNGKDIELIVSRDAKGRALVMDPEQYANPPEGKDVVLTIDSEHQRFLEMQLKEVYEQQKAKRAYGLIIDTKTGALRAAANWPNYDANKALTVKSDLRKNYLFQEAQEQGSTIKTFAIGAALENRIYKPGSVFPCHKGKFKIGRRTISDSSEHDCDEMSLNEALKLSSNVVLTHAALGVGEQKMREFYNQMGFGQKTGLDFPGEALGIYKSKKWSEHLLASASFGHGFTATPIQLAAAYAAIANDGLWKQPHLVEKIISPTGLESKLKLTEKMIMSAKTAKTLRAMLTSVTSPGGTGEAARVPGYLVAGKTGTANKVDLEKGGYSKEKYLSSFIGMVPADQPRFVIYIGVDEPEKEHYASLVAAPVFSKVAQFILTKENILPSQLDHKDFIQCEGNSCIKPIAKKADQLNGMAFRQALNFLRTKNVDARFKGQGLVSKVEFIKGKKLEKGSRVLVHMSN